MSNTVSRPNDSNILFPIFVKSGKRRDQYRAGFVDRVGSIVIEPVYDCAGRFREGFGPVKSGALWGFVSASGEIVIQPFSGGEADFFENRAVFTDPRTAKCGVIDQNNQVVVSPRYFRVGRFSMGLTWMSNEGAWNSQPGSYGLLSADGDEILPFSFDDLRDFSEGLAAAKMFGKWGFIDSAGNFVLSPTYDAAIRFSEGVARVKSGEHWGFINHFGEYVFQTSYAAALDFHDGLAGVETSHGWGFINLDGDFVIDPFWQRIGPFKNGLARVEATDRVGYINRSGELVIGCDFDLAQDFHAGRALVETKSEIGYIDEQGSFIWRGSRVEVGFAYL